MSRLRDILRSHPLGVVYIAAFVPLSLLLLLQYSWLADMREMSAGAHRSDRHDYLEKVASEIKLRYHSAAERGLNLPSSLFTQDRVELAAKHFRKVGMGDAKHFFAARLLDRDWTVYFYDPEWQRMVRKPYLPEVRAAVRAATKLKVAAERGEVLYKVELVVDESDPEHRVILNPILDEDSRVVGVTGMILDEVFFEESIVPEIIQTTITPFLSEYAVVTVRDERGRLAFATSKPLSRWSEVEVSLPFVFEDWRIGIHSRKATPEQLASRNFTINVALLAVVWVLLLAGLALALRAASREIRLSRMKSDFVSNVSHELRTPLASIRVFGEMLRLGKATDPPKVREYGEYIETESRRLGQLLNNILDFSRIESHARTYTLEDVDLPDVIDEVLDTFRVRLQHEGFEVDVDVRQAQLPSLRIDRQALRQAIGNVLDNAIKYSNEERYVGIKLHREGTEAVIAITDRGLGIPRAEQPRIFERFHRVGSALVHDVKGSGLGLAIVRHIVEAHGGRVSVQSETGRGSTFFIRLPIETVASRAQAETGSDDTWGGATGGALAPAPGSDGSRGGSTG